jgi:hypothetical protein
LSLISSGHNAIPEVKDGLYEFLHVEGPGGNMGFFEKQSTSKTLQALNILLEGCRVKTRIEGQSLFFRGFVGETRIDVAGSGAQTADGLEVSETIRLDTVIDMPPWEDKTKWINMINLYASNGALIEEADGKFHIKSRLSVYSEKHKGSINVIHLTLLVAMTHPYAGQAAMVDMMKLPVSKCKLSDDSSLDGVWKPEAFSRAAAMLKESGASAHSDNDSLTAKFPWDPKSAPFIESYPTGSMKRTSLMQTFIESFTTGSMKGKSLMQIHCYKHPNLGKGLFCKLDLPMNLSDPELFELAIKLNHMEYTAEDWPPFLGAWTSMPKTGRLTFVNFWPNMFVKRIDLEHITAWMAARAQVMSGSLQNTPLSAK